MNGHRPGQARSGQGRTEHTIGARGAEGIEIEVMRAIRVARRPHHAQTQAGTVRHHLLPTPLGRAMRRHQARLRRIREIEDVEPRVERGIEPAVPSGQPKPADVDPRDSRAVHLPNQAESIIPPEDMQVRRLQGVEILAVQQQIRNRSSHRDRRPHPARGQLDVHHAAIHLGHQRKTSRHRRRGQFSRQHDLAAQNRPTRFAQVQNGQPAIRHRHHRPTASARHRGRRPGQRELRDAHRIERVAGIEHRHPGHALRHHRQGSRKTEVERRALGGHRRQNPGSQRRSIRRIKPVAHFRAIQDAVRIRVRRIGIRAQHEFAPIMQSVPVAIPGCRRAHQHGGNGEPDAAGRRTEADGSLVEGGQLENLQVVLTVRRQDQGIHRNPSRSHRPATHHDSGAGFDDGVGVNAHGRHGGGSCRALALHRPPAHETRSGGTRGTPALAGLVLGRLISPAPAV